jgi:hypothetical protein
MHDYVEQLENGRFILASWVPCACEWYALPIKNPARPVTAGTLEDLARRRGVKTYGTREEAEAAARDL